MSETARRIALVTGGSRGIGKAICERLGRDGIHLLINYRSNSVAAEETLENIRKSGGSGELLPFDVSDRKSIEKVLTEWHEKNRDDYISLLVNNAGITRDSMLMWMQDEEWHDVIDTNLHSVFYITRFLIKNMLMNKYGRIVNVVSLSGQKGLPGQVNYSAAKAGVIGATKSLALEVARKNVTVNAVSPGFIASDMTKDLDEKELKKIIPMRRFGKPEEVAGAVAFLLSDDASYITGEVISLNGGLYT